MDTNDNDAVSLSEMKTWKQKEWNESSSSVGGANERMRDGDATKTIH